MRPRRLVLLFALALAILAGPASAARAADPWSLTDSLNGSAWIGHTATLLQDGRVLLAGGRQINSATARALLYDPEAARVVGDRSMGSARTDHTATALPDAARCSCKVRATGRGLGWRGRASLTLAARRRLGAGAYTLVLRPGGRTPVRLRVTLP